MSIQDRHRGSDSMSLSSDTGLDTSSLELPICSNDNPLQLALSDIMHHMSPSPVPPEDSRIAEDSYSRGPYSSATRREREGSSEPLAEVDVMATRRRLHELGFSLDRDRNGLSMTEDLIGYSDDLDNPTLREKELVNMVLRLTDPLPMNSAQLERQAEIISLLTSQRDFLVRQAEEDHDRWRSEREGWDRMAEALLSHRNRTGKSAAREDEAERQKVHLESENRALRDKLQDTQNRLSSLESELMKLKPLLLMQPYSLDHLRQNLASQPQASSQPPTTAKSTVHGFHQLPAVRPNKPLSDAKGKRRDADPDLSRTLLEAVPEDLRTNERRGSGTSLLAQSSGSLTPSTNVPLFSGLGTPTADIYRRPEPLLQYSYPYNHHYSTPSASPARSTPIPPKITVNSPLSTSTGHSQLQQHTIVGSTSRTAESAVLPTTPSQSQSQSHPSPQAGTTVSPQQRRSRDYVSLPTGVAHNVPIRRSNHKIAPLTSDARTEHILLAARRIGRERAGLLAGIRDHADREKEKLARDLEVLRARQDLERSENERLERLANGTSGLAYYRTSEALTSPQPRNTRRGSAIPRTPKRGGGVGATHYPSLGRGLSNSPISTPTRAPTSAVPSTFVFVNTSAAPGTSEYSGGVLSTPGQLGSVLISGSTVRAASKNLPSNPPTPLDSLLDAARSMMDDGSSGKAGGKTNGRRKGLEHPESPVPKRRKMSSSGSKMLGRDAGVGANTGVKITRVRSALDVLADQAAAASDEPGQIVRGFNSGGKGKGEKPGNDDWGSAGDEVADSIQGDGVGRHDQRLAPTSSVGPSRGRSRAKTTNINLRPIVEPTSTSSMSLRPVRQATQKRLASQDLQPSSSLSTTSKGKGKRGRPKGNKSQTRSTVPAKSASTLKVNSSLGGPRVIASASEYSPLDEAITLQARKDRKWEPVVEWEQRVAEEDEGEEDVEGEGDVGCISPAVTGGCGIALDQQNARVEGRLDANDAITVEAGNNKTTSNEADPVQTQIHNVPTTDGCASSANVDILTIPPVDDADADAEADLDEDAEGEQDEEEEEDENADAEGSQDRSSRSRTPPPPDPPHSGAAADSNDDADADADAEGDMEFDENEEPPPTSTSSAAYQTSLSVSVGQAPPCNFDESFLDNDVWVIKVFWTKSDRSCGCDMSFTHVLISAMVPESFPSSLSILSDLSERMSLQLPYPAQGQGSVVGSRQGWWRSIDVKGAQGKS